MKKTMTNKSIDEIINRDDYARLTKTMKDRTEEIAVKVRRKMNDLDLDTIKVDGLTLTVKKYSADYGFLWIDYESMRSYHLKLAKGPFRCNKKITFEDSSLERR